MADYFTGKGIDVTGMSFLSAGSLFGTAGAISADGTVMVGNGSKPAGGLRAVRATPPVRAAPVP